MERYPDDKLFYAMAKEIVYDQSMWDDVVQEARIHDWLVRKDHPGMPEPWYHKSVRRRIAEVSKRQTWTGYESHRGHPIDPLRRSHDSIEELCGETDKPNYRAFVNTLHIERSLRRRL